MLQPETAPEEPARIEVTATDLGTGDSETVVITDDYVLTCAGSAYVAHVSRYAELAEQAAGGRQAAAAAEEQRHVNEVISAHKDWIEAELDKADAKLAAAVAAERERIRQLAIRNHAVCTGDDGTSCFFADLITEPSGG